MKKEKDSDLNISMFPRSRCRAYCPRCEKPVDLMSFEESAEFYKTNVGSIEALTEAGDLHRVHNSKGKVLICGESLFKNFDNRQTQKLDKKMLPRFDLKNAIKDKFLYFRVREKNLCGRDRKTAS